MALSLESLAQLTGRLDSLESQARAPLMEQGFTAAQIGVQRFLNLRYDGTDVAVMTPCATDGGHPAEAFEAQVSLFIT